MIGEVGKWEYRTVGNKEEQKEGKGRNESMNLLPSDFFH